MKWSNMHKTLNDDEEQSEEDEEEDTKKKDPVMVYEAIPHNGGVNRIRSMHGSNLVATWSDENEIGVYDVSKVIDVLRSKK